MEMVDQVSDKNRCWPARVLGYIALYLGQGLIGGQGGRPTAKGDVMHVRYNISCRGKASFDALIHV